MKVTSKTGKQIELAINANSTEITAKAGGIEFGAVQTAAGFKSRFSVNVGGQRVVIDVAFEGAELVKVQSLFAELQEAVVRRSAAQAENDRHHAGVLKMMAE